VRCADCLPSFPFSFHCPPHRETLTALGPSYIKAGQVLASRPDIVREDYMSELCLLQVSRGVVERGLAEKGV
jgi:ubiquinone biosynthesis protein